MATRAINIASPVTVINAVALCPASNVVPIKGRSAKARAQNEAFTAIAPNSFAEEGARLATITILRAALGTDATADQVNAAQVEWTIGRVAARLPANIWGPDIKAIDKLEYARRIVCFYAAPPKEGAAARKLRAGQLGRRTVTEHKVVRAAEEAWSQVKTEIGYGTAKPQAIRAKAARGANNKVATSTKAPKPTAPTHSELVKPEGIKSANDACGYIENMAATLSMFANKHAALLPTNYGTMIRAFKSNIDAAAKVRKEAK